MDKAMFSNGYCAAIHDKGVGVEIEYLGFHREFPDVSRHKKAEYPALIPGWTPPSKKARK